MNLPSKNRLSHYLSSVLPPFILLCILYFMGFYSQYLLFHFFAEFFAVFVAFSIAMIVYFTYPFSKNNYLKFLGLGYFAVAFLDLMHVLSFPGMPFIVVEDINITISFWVLTRLFEALILLTAPFSRAYLIKIPTLIVSFSLVAVIVTFIALFEPLFLFDKSTGLTALKNELEYVIIFILLVALFINIRKKGQFNVSVYWKIQVAIVLTIFSEYCFTRYDDVTATFNIIGHLSKFLSFWFIFIAVVKTTLQKPVETMRQDADSYDAIPNPVMILDSSGTVRQLNKAAEKLINLPKSKIISKDNHLFFHPQELNKSECPLCLAVKENREIDHLVLTGTTDSRSFRYSLSRISGTGGGMIQVCRDISEEVSIQEEISQQNSILNAVMDGTPDLIFYKDYLYQGGVYLGCNHAFEKFVGKSKDQIVGKTDIDLFGTEIGRNFQHYDRGVLNKKHNLINEEWVHYANGQAVLLSTSKSPLYNKENEILGVLGISRDISRYKQLKKEVLEQKQTLEYQNNYDLLTSLANKTLLLDRIKQSIKLSSCKECRVAVLLIDLDAFKEINDSLGHHTGDLVIKEVALRLQSCISETDTVARLGGDEFVILLSELRDENRVVDIIEKLQNVMKKAICISENSFYCTLSIGVSLYPRDGKNAQELLKNADAAMYKAKDEGRNTYRFYTQEMTEKAFERIVMESSLRSAMKNKEFVVYYQPQTNAEQDQHIGMEALIRWRHPAMGMVSPDKFITLAEETGFIVELDRWTMRQAMKQMVIWYEAGLNPGVLSLNLSMKQLQQNDFIEVLAAMLEETRCNAQWLALEVTEGQIMVNPDDAILVLQAVSAMGIELAIDDFGTGYSSLSYLKRLPVNKLKIDQSFIRGLPGDEDDVAITKAVISLAQNLHLSVIAEGVESIEQINFLVDNGCFNIQGYYYGKPMSEDEMTVYLNR